MNCCDPAAEYLQVALDILGGIGDPIHDHIEVHVLQGRLELLGW